MHVQLSKLLAIASIVIGTVLLPVQSAHAKRTAWMMCIPDSVVLDPTWVKDFNGAAVGDVLATATDSLYLSCGPYSGYPGPYTWIMTVKAPASSYGSNVCETDEPGIGIRYMSANAPDQSVPCDGMSEPIVAVTWASMNASGEAVGLHRTVNAQLVKTQDIVKAPGQYKPGIAAHVLMAKTKEIDPILPVVDNPTISINPSPALVVKALCQDIGINQTVDFGKAKVGDKKQFGVKFGRCNISDTVLGHTRFTLLGGTAGTNRLPMKTGEGIVQGVAIDITPGQGNAVKFGTAYTPTADTHSTTDATFNFGAELVETGLLKGGRIDASMTLKVEMQ